MRCEIHGGKRNKKKLFENRKFTNKTSYVIALDTYDVERIIVFHCIIDTAHVLIVCEQVSRANDGSVSKPPYMAIIDQRLLPKKITLVIIECH